MLPGERGFAQGITHAGSRLGAAMTPPLVVWFITRYNWRAAFITFGVMGVALVRRVVFLLSRHCPNSTRRQPRRARSDPLRHRRRAAPRRSRRSLAKNSLELRPLVSRRDVFLLQLLPLHLSRLVPDLPASISRLRSQAHGILREPSAARRNRWRSRRRMALRYSPAPHFEREPIAPRRRRLRIPHRVPPESFPPRSPRTPKLA